MVPLTTPPQPPPHRRRSLPIILVSLLLVAYAKLPMFECLRLDLPLVTDIGTAHNQKTTSHHVASFVGGLLLTLGIFNAILNWLKRWQHARSVFQAPSLPEPVKPSNIPPSFIQNIPSPPLAFVVLLFLVFSILGKNV